MKSCISIIVNMQNRIQAVIRTKGGFTHCRMTFQNLTGNEISFNIKCFVA